MLQIHKLDRVDFHKQICSDFQISFSFKKVVFSMQVMLLGFVLLGRSLEEGARLKASSDMNELLVSYCFVTICFMPCGR